MLHGVSCCRICISRAQGQFPDGPSLGCFAASCRRRGKGERTAWGPWFCHVLCLSCSTEELAEDLRKMAEETGQRCPRVPLPHRGGTPARDRRPGGRSLCSCCLLEACAAVCMIAICLRYTSSKDSRVAYGLPSQGNVQLSSCLWTLQVMVFGWPVVDFRRRGHERHKNDYSIMVIMGLS